MEHFHHCRKFPWMDWGPEQHVLMQNVVHKLRASAGTWRLCEGTTSWAPPLTTFCIRSSGDGYRGWRARESVLTSTPRWHLCSLISQDTVLKGKPEVGLWSWKTSWYSDSEDLRCLVTLSTPVRFFQTSISKRMWLELPHWQLRASSQGSPTVLPSSSK